MKFFEGKTPTERNKIIAAIVLGALSLFALYLAFGPSGKKTTVTAVVSPTPKPSPSPGDKSNFDIPTVDAQDLEYTMQMINYNGGTPSAPDPGRNIFAFYEPPPPTPYSPTPIPQPSIPTPVPERTPNVAVTFINPQGVYAGTKGFRMEVSGDKFTPEVRIYYQGSEMPTTFISQQQLATDIPANFIAQSGGRIIEVRTPDGKLWSNQISFNVQEAPRPQFQYIGMIARKRGNNDTAYFQETGKALPFGARLNDVVSGRFRLVSISSGEVIFEDTSLGFRHRLALFRPAPGGGATSTGGRGSFPSSDSGFPQGMPMPVIPDAPQNIPGIPNNIPRATPNNMPANTRRTIDNNKKDVDDDDDDDTDN
jgi:hypothetical protein